MESSLFQGASSLCSHCNSELFIHPYQGTLSTQLMNQTSPAPDALFITGRTREPCSLCLMLKYLDLDLCNISVLSAEEFRDNAGVSSPECRMSGRCSCEWLSHWVITTAAQCVCVCLCVQEWMNGWACFSQKDNREFSDAVTFKHHQSWNTSQSYLQKNIA